MAASKETANSRRDNLCDENASNEQVCKAPFRSLFEKSRVVNSLVNLKGVVCEVVCFQGFSVFVFDKSDRSCDTFGRVLFSFFQIERL